MGKILVVAVDRALANCIARALLMIGHEVRTACSSAEALAVAKAFPFDAALVDRSMPGLDDGMLLEQLMRARPESSYVLMSDHNGKAAYAEAIAPSARALLSHTAEPYTPRVLPLQYRLPFAAGSAR